MSLAGDFGEDNVGDGLFFFDGGAVGVFCIGDTGNDGGILTTGGCV